MSERDQEQTQSVPPIGSNETSEGYLHLEVDTDRQPTEETSIQSSVVPDVKPATPLSTQAFERTGTAEHLAIQRPVPALNVNDPDIKQHLTALRAEMTRLITSLRWEGISVEETAQHLLPLLNVGPIQQWQPVLIPFLYEIDRGGALLPIWLYLIDDTTGEPF